MMRPRDFLDVAWDLSAGSREGDWRSAVSRAYYAAFHIGRQLLQQCGFEVPDADQAHAFVWLRLSNAGHPEVQQAGARLRHLRYARNWADYDLDRPFNQVTAIDQVQIAADIFEVLESAGTEPAFRAQITEAIKTYERDVLRKVTWHS